MYRSKNHNVTEVFRCRLMTFDFRTAKCEVKAKLNFTLPNVNGNDSMDSGAASTLSPSGETSDLRLWPIFEEGQRADEDLSLGTPEEKKTPGEHANPTQRSPKASTFSLTRQTGKPPCCPSTDRDNKWKGKTRRSWWGSLVNFAGNFLSSPVISSTHQSWRRPTGRGSLRLSYPI